MRIVRLKYDGKFPWEKDVCACDSAAHAKAAGQAVVDMYNNTPFDPEMAGVTMSMFTYYSFEVYYHEGEWK